MKLTKRILSGLLSAGMILSLTACDEDPAVSGGNSAGNTPGAPAVTTTAATTTTDPDDNAPTDAEIKEVGTDAYTPDGKSGTIVWLGYYDLITDGSASEQYKIFNSELYGGDIEYVSTTSGTAYFEKLATMISSDDSPDIVRYEWQSFPTGMSKNMYEPLDGEIDMTSPLWSDMAETAERFAYKGKHYYYPYRITTNFALNYNRKSLEEYALDDPYDLYMNNQWTWDTFKQLLIDWCSADDSHIGYAGEGAMSFIATTGTSLVKVQEDGTARNNISDINVSRAMEYCADLYRNGLTYQNEIGDWVSPQLWADNSDRILFLGMNPEWTYGAAAGQVQNKPGAADDICNTVSDFAFVPFPRDPQADKYYIAYDTFGYLVAKGAKNKKGALDWINLCRVYETDPAVNATKKQEAINPEPVYFTSGKYEGLQKWALVWDERQYDLWQDMMDPSKFSFTFDDCWGFNDDLKTICNTILFDPMFHGESFTKLSAEYSPVIDSIING